MTQSSACCFTGHRKLPQERLPTIVKNLHHQIDTLIAQGVTDFISGGALGFDQIAASLILAKKETMKDLRLIFVLPCPEQDILWTAAQKNFYQELLLAADKILYVSAQYEKDCMKRRNRFMVELSAFCICALLYPASGTAQTVAYAKAQGLCILQVAK